MPLLHLLLKTRETQLGVLLSAHLDWCMTYHGTTAVRLLKDISQCIVEFLILSTSEEKLAVTGPLTFCHEPSRHTIATVGFYAA